MKKQLIAILLLLSMPLFSQTKMIIYKTDGTIDSVLLSQIGSINFSTTSGPVPTQGLAAYWPFDGNAVDSSGNGYNGTIYYAALTQNRFGVDSNAYSFDGIGDAIEFGNILNQVFCAPVAKFSISGWALVRSNGSNVNSVIIAKNAGGTTGPYQWSVSYSYGNIIGGVFSDTLAQNYIELASPVSLNQWFHFVLVFDGSQPKLQRVQFYVNGSNGSVSSYANVGNLGTTTTASQQSISIGASRIPNSLAWSDFLNGDVDDIRIYNRALSAAEVMNLYLAPN
jgi:hypothetical protein